MCQKLYVKSELLKSLPYLLFDCSVHILIQKWPWSCYDRKICRISFTTSLSISLLLPFVHFYSIQNSIDKVGYLVSKLLVNKPGHCNWKLWKLFLFVCAYMYFAHTCVCVRACVRACVCVCVCVCERERERDRDRQR